MVQPIGGLSLPVNGEIRKEGDIMCDINGHHWLQPRDQAGFAHWSAVLPNPENPEFYFIAPEDLNGAQNGDVVVATVAPTPFPGTNCFAACVVQLLSTSSEFKFIQVTGTINLEGEEGGFLFNRETSEVVFIPRDWLNGADDGDFVLVESRLLPPNHPYINRAQWEGHVLSVIEKGTITFESVIFHVMPSHKEGVEGVGWVAHPGNPYQRIVVPVEHFNGARDLDRVTVVARHQQGHIIGHVTCIHASAGSTQSSVVETEEGTPRTLSQVGNGLLDPIIMVCSFFVFFHSRASIINTKNEIRCFFFH